MRQRLLLPPLLERRQPRADSAGRVTAPAAHGVRGRDAGAHRAQRRVGSVLIRCFGGSESRIGGAGCRS
jgi:hypothetical protein